MQHIRNRRIGEVIVYKDQKYVTTADPLDHCGCDECDIEKMCDKPIDSVDSVGLFNQFGFCDEFKYHFKKLIKNQKTKSLELTEQITIIDNGDK